jgi:ABC-type uncharacterized transport system permease subunit
VLGMALMVSRLRAPHGGYSRMMVSIGMRVAVALSLTAVLGSCAFAVRHPAITTGVIGAVIAGGTCELAVHDNADGAKGDQLACGVATGAVGLGLGLVVAAAIWLGGEGHTILVEEPIVEPPQPIHTFKHAPPPDAGVIEIDAAAVETPPPS